MEKMMHKAAQYLATAAISFVEKKDDDSHTNLGWVNHKLKTHKFNNGHQLALNYKAFSLEWLLDSGEMEQFPLDSKTHKEIVDWLKHTSAMYISDKKYEFALHYDLPYEDITPTTRFELQSQDALDQLIRNRDLAQEVFNTLLKLNKYESDIRIWPHHFDTGAFVVINDQLSIGMGMAMPDSMISDFYFYMSGYNGHDAILLENITYSSASSYHNEDWKGFAKAIQDQNLKSAVDFCQSAINDYISA